MACSDALWNTVLKLMCLQQKASKPTRIYQDNLLQPEDSRQQYVFEWLVPRIMYKVKQSSQESHFS